MWQEDSRNWSPPVIGSGAKGWAPATGGNMSVRQDDTWCWLSESGRDKGSLTTEDFLQVEIATNQAPSGRKRRPRPVCTPWCIACSRKPTWCCNVHTVNATVLSRIEKSDTLALQGYEMQKTLSGQHSHLDTVPIAIFDNDQDIDALAARIADYAQTRPLRYGFLLRGPRPDLAGGKIFRRPAVNWRAGVPVRVAS
ncbi:methylthioribulose-1-phosphate dehydratase [Klebsiella pneumoniae subsp. pneumoniae]|uniref:Methylthioribulose-1-phosphate dehydratase n=1 Tax=Klebsiella pneumoniae subsp. pneumoniae TaxID=72407 RepID=A0A378A5Z8_KLEPN|nr:methylthioribulose-1-phosphate dehydratase [Klebsiella pneumoniae subsp. pneumoniae]